MIFTVTIFIKLSTAGPYPVPSEESDSSVESQNYRYPDFENSLSPYWRAFGPEYHTQIKEHDRLELDVLKHVRHLDFKIKESWTITDIPFAASH